VVYGVLKDEMQRCSSSVELLCSVICLTFPVHVNEMEVATNTKENNEEESGIED